jgi:hypothetical protein
MHKKAANPRGWQIVEHLDRRDLLLTWYPIAAIALRRFDLEAVLLIVDPR